MMIAPETYYDMMLKGKSVSEIQRQIRGLRWEMNDARKKLEDPDYEPIICPSEDVILSVDRDYLFMAKKALIEAGGQYTESEEEKKDRIFNENLGSLKKLTFSILFGVFKMETAEFAIHEGEVMVNRTEAGVKSINEDHYLKEYESDYSPEELIEELRDLHLGEWKEKYKREDVGVLDGAEWNLSLYLENEEQPIHFGGENSTFPYNFDHLLMTLGIESNCY